MRECVLVGEMSEGADDEVKRRRGRKARGDQTAESGNRMWNSYERFGRGQGGDFRRDSIEDKYVADNEVGGRCRPRMTFFCGSRWNGETGTGTSAVAGRGEKHGKCC